MECADFQSLSGLIAACKNAEQDQYLNHLKKKGQKGTKSPFDFGTMQVDPNDVLKSSESEEDLSAEEEQRQKELSREIIESKVDDMLEDFEKSFNHMMEKAQLKNKAMQIAIGKHKIALAAQASQASRAKEEKMQKGKEEETKEIEKQKPEVKQETSPRKEDEKKQDQALPRVDDKKEPESFIGRKDTYTSSHAKSYIASTVLRGGGPVKVYYFSTMTSITLNVPSKCKVSEAVKIFLFSFESDPSKDQSLVKYKNRPDCYELYFPDDDEEYIPSNLPLAQDSELSEFDSLCFVLMENPEAQKIFSVQKTGTLSIHEMQKALRNKEVIFPF